MEWFKLYAEFASDPKVQSMSETMQRRLVMLYCLRCAGDLDKLDDHEIALALRISPKELEKTRVLFVRKGFISEGWSMPKWEKRQAPTDPKAAERMRRYRERLREQDRNVTRNVPNAIRVEEEVEREETRGEQNPPLPPSIVLGDEYTQLGEWAIGIGACVSWGTWVSHQGMCGHSVKDIRAAIEEAAGAGKLNQGYVAAKLRAWAAQGGRPKPRGEANGKTAVQQRPEETRIPLKPRYIPDGPEGDVLREMWGIAKREATG